MKTTIARKWGNSVAVRLPAKAAKRFGIREGVPVEVIEEAKTRSFSIRPIPEHAFTLEQLLSQITPANRHEIIDWGKPKGKEIW
jgi:antitoxin MazE